MRNLKKFLALVLALVMAFSLMVSANAAVTENVTYPDDGVVLDEFKDAVTVLSGMGVFRGDNGNFKPQNSIMRCEAVAILYRLTTGDVDDSQVALYAPLATYFKDVKATDWFAPYVGFAVDAGYIKGYNGNFNPYANVTGYEMLAMLLRAVGYGKNGEFTGSQWRINVGAQAESLGLLNDIKSTHYNNTLSQASAREVVADLTFQAANIPTVRYEYGYYNPYIGVAMAPSGTNNVKNDTLGEREFGLTEKDPSGVVVGNQATGENGTLVGGGNFISGSTDARDNYNYKIIVEYTNTTKSTIVGYVTRYLPNGNLNDTTNNTNGNDYDTATAAIATEAGGGAACNFAYLTQATVASSQYAYGAGVKFNFKTGLDLFGHAVSVWYDRRNSSSKGFDTYAIIDKATWTDTVYADDAILSEASATGDVSKAKLGQAAIDAGFSVQRDASKSNPSTAHFSDRYSQMSTGTAANGTANASPVKMYALVSNSSNKKVDVVIALSAEVGKIAEKNTTAAVPYLTLGSTTTAVSTFTNDATETDRIYLDNLTPDTKDEQKTIGALVTANQIVGTSFDLASALTIAGAQWADVQYQLDPMVTKNITVSSYLDGGTTINTADHVIATVTPTTGDTLKLSGITEGNKIISRALPIAVNDNTAALPLELMPQAGVTYAAYIDQVGRFISLVPISDYKFLYGTYADYVIGGLGTGTIGYNMVGVDWDAKEQPENTLKSIGGVANPIDGTKYNGLTVTMKDQGTTAGAIGNEIRAGYNTGYMYNAATGDLSTTVTGATLFTGTSTGIAATAATDLRNWVITSDDAANGFARVKNHDGTNDVDYLLTKDTEFIIVTGTGTATLEVETAKGLTGLLAGGTSAEIAGSFGWDAAAGGGAGAAANNNEVWFQTAAEQYGTTSTGNNAVITKVILSDGNLTRWNAQTLYFNFNGANATGATLPGAAATVAQYALWNNGELGYYFIDTSVSTKVGGTAWSALTDVEAQTFYTLSKIKDVNGTPVYKAVALTNPAKVDYSTGHNSKSTGADAVIYDYITVTNLESALLKKGTATLGTTDNELVYDVTGAKVCDVQYKTDTAGTVTNVRNEITSVLELNNAVSVMKSNASTPVYNNIEVAVVYDGSAISMIYVTAVPTT